MFLRGIKGVRTGLRSACGGFSFLELMVSICILASSIMLILGLFVHLFNASQKSVDLTAGTVVAESVLQKYLYDTPFPPQNLAIPYSGVVQLNNQAYIYTIYVQDINSSLKRVDAVVTWWNRTPDRASKEGYGMLKTEISRLIYRNSRIFEP